MASGSSNTADRVRPRMAHFVVRTNKFSAELDWYKTVFEADVVFENDSIAFLSFDEEHHRIAIVSIPDLADADGRTSAIDHVAFTFDRLSQLLLNYERLAGCGILPAHAINHGPTTSLYYADPDGNKIELQVDNYPTVEAATAFFFTDAFAKNPIGVAFEPDALLARLRAGEPEEELLRQAA